MRIDNFLYRHFKQINHSTSSISIQPVEKITYGDNSTKRYRNILRHELELKWMNKLQTPHPHGFNRHVITGNLNVIPDARVRNSISKGPKYRFPSKIDFSKCRREIAASLNDFSNRLCKWENVEPDALKE